MMINENNSLLYGELTVVGTNGILNSQETDTRKCCKMSLFRRDIANGLCKGLVSYVKSTEDNKLLESKKIHVVSYTLAKDRHVLVEYISDDKFDMFQIGRSDDAKVDFVISEQLQQPPQYMHLSSSDIERMVSHPLRQCNLNKNFGIPKQLANSAKIISTPARKNDSRQFSRQSCDLDPSIIKTTFNNSSTVSRFACRIMIKRDPPHTAQIFAAGFDSSSNIFLGERAIKWEMGNELDGFTTNGIMVLSPNTDIWHKLDQNDNKDNEKPVWREVSVLGNIYEMRPNRSDPPETGPVYTVDNILQDGTLIDLCGITLIWRSASGLKQTADLNDLETTITLMNAIRFQCPIRMQTLLMPRPKQNSKKDEVVQSKQAHVYLKCGHVHGWHEWDKNTMSDDELRTCSLCIQKSKFVPLKLGQETAFYVDQGYPFTYCFNPCGHMASEATIKCWCSIRLLNRNNSGITSRCPFCAAAIQEKPVRLIFQADIDEEKLMYQFISSI